MSAAIISSLVRCDEWDRKHEKKDQNTTETKGCLGGTESTWHMEMQYELTSSGESEWDRCARRTHVWMERSSQTRTQGCCSQNVACQTRGWRVWKFRQFLSPAGGLPSQMLPLEKRTRGEQTRVKAGLQIQLTAWHKHQHSLELTPTEQYRRTAGHMSPERGNTGWKRACMHQKTHP